MAAAVHHLHHLAEVLEQFFYWSCESPILFPSRGGGERGGLGRAIMVSIDGTRGVVV